ASVNGSGAAESAKGALRSCVLNMLSTSITAGPFPAANLACTSLARCFGSMTISAVSALPVHESPTGRIQAHSRNEGKGTQTCAAAFVSGSSMRVTILKLRHCPGCGSNLTAALAKPGIVHAAAARAAEPARNSRLLVILVSFLLLRLL